MRAQYSGFARRVVAGKDLCACWILTSCERIEQRGATNTGRTDVILVNFIARPGLCCVRAEAYAPLNLHALHFCADTLSTALGQRTILAVTQMEGVRAPRSVRSRPSARGPRAPRAQRPNRHSPSRQTQCPAVQQFVDYGEVRLHLLRMRARGARGLSCAA